MKVERFKTQMEARLSSRNKIPSLDCKEVSSSGLKMSKVTSQVEGVIALAWLSVKVEDCEEDEVLG